MRAHLLAAFSVAAAAFRPAAMAPRRARSAVSAAATQKFTKYQGIGNDFILVDNRDAPDPVLTPAQSAALCDRNFGVGGDGVIFALPPADGASAEYRMRIYNSDGTEPEMCGNGIRCMARYLCELEGKEAEGATYRIETLAGPIVPEVRPDGLVTVDMGMPILDAAAVPTTLGATQDGAAVLAPIEALGVMYEATCVSMGNPHCVVFVDDLDALDLMTVGPALEAHEAFPAKVNAEFVQVLSPTHLRMKVFERGAGPTLACGTGACALVVAAVLAGKVPERVPVTVTLPGGDLIIDWNADNGKIYMTGPAERVFAGEAAVLVSELEVL